MFAKKRKNKILRISVFLLLLLYFVMEYYKCPFYFFLGVSCPGCGMSRAFVSLLHLDFVQAFRYHPLYPIVIVGLIIWFLHKKKIIGISKKTQDILLILVALLFVAVYALRLWQGSDVLVWDWAQGFFAKKLLP